MTIKILIKRRIPKDKQEEVLPYLIQLRSMAAKQPGYVSGETLRNLDDVEGYLVISTWQTTKDWEKWLANQKRNEIQKEIEQRISGQTEYERYAYD